MPITTDLVAFGVIIIATIAGVWWKIEARFEAKLKFASDERKALSAELAEYKLYAAQNHVSAGTLKDTEERLITAIDKLGNRLETIVSRLDKMTSR